MNKQEIERAKECAACIHDHCPFHRCISCNVTEVLQSVFETVEHQLAYGWIPVSEQLPDKGVNVLVTWVTHDKIENTYEEETEIGYISVDYPHKWKLTRHYPVSEINITAWQPLPEPYKEVRHEE